MSEFKLPTKKQKPLDENPRFMVLFGRPKQGKTTLMAGLENNLIVDLEDGTNYIEAMAVKANSINDLRQIRQAVIEAGKPYKYITIDTITVLEDLVNALALQLYRATPMGKHFGLKADGTYDMNIDIKTLPNGAGYLYVRDAFFKVLDSFRGISEYLILVGHTKDKNINKEGKELSENSLDLSGKLERLVCSKADALGFIYREGNKTHVNFNGGGDSIVEARPSHLRGQDLIIMESDDDGNLTYYWDKIFK